MNSMERNNSKTVAVYYCLRALLGSKFTSSCCCKLQREFAVVSLINYPSSTSMQVQETSILHVLFNLYLNDRMETHFHILIIIWKYSELMISNDVTKSVFIYISYLNFCHPTNGHTIETLQYHKTTVDLLRGKKLPFKTISFALLQVPSNRKHFTSKSTSNYPLKARRVRNYATKLSK